MAMFGSNRGLGSGILRPLVIVVVLCFLMFLLYAYNSTNTELKQHKERSERLARQQETLKTQIRDLLDARGRLEKELQKAQAEQTKCIRDMEELKKSYVSQVDSLKETLKFRVSSLENENSELQSRADSYEEKYNELNIARKKDQDLFSVAQEKCRESTQKLEAQSAELNVQMTDMQRNLDAFRLDRLTNEGVRQNCTNELSMCKMKFGQLQGEFQQMSTKLKMMGDSFAERSTTKQNNPRGGDQRGVNTRSQNVAGHFQDSQKDHLKTQGHDDVAKKDVMQALRDKLDRGEHLQDSEQLLFQALAKTANKAHTGTQQEQPHPLEKQPHPSQEQPHPSDEWKRPLQNQPPPQRQPSQKEQQPQWFEKVDNQLLNKDTQDLMKRMGGNIPAPPFMKDDFNQQAQQQNDATAAKPNQDAAGNDQNNFEKDQRDEERRLFEMFQGDTHHVKDNTNEGDDGKRFDKEDGDYGDKNKDDYDEKEGEENTDDDDNYNEKDEDYMYGDQKNQVKPAEQGDNALI